MSGGNKKKKSSNTSGNNGKNGNSKQKNNNSGNTNENILSDDEKETIIEVEAEPVVSVPAIDVLDRLAPPVLFFPPNVAEEYIGRFCPVNPTPKGSWKKNLLAEEGFPEREVPVMRRLLAMMAGIMSKASAAAARAYYSRVAGTEGRRNGYFQQNLNTSVFNLFSTLSAGNNPSPTGVNTTNNTTTPSNSDMLHLTPPAAFTAKDGEPLRGYPSRLMKFWRQLSLAEQVRLVREEHAALTNEWIESRKSWCLCAHCKHRRMTINDLTDCVYQTYCEELEAFISSNGNGSTLYSPSLNNSLEPAAKARRFLFRSLSVVGEQALLPRYNQFILRLEAFSSMAFSMKNGNGNGPHNHPPHHSSTSNSSNHNHSHTHVHTSTTSTTTTTKIRTPLKNITKDGIRSAALQASKEFLQRAHPGKHLNDSDEIEELFFDSEYLKQLSRSIDGFDDENGEDSDDYDNPHQQEKANQGGIQSEDDDDIIDEETDLPIDESELMLPGGSSFPLLPVGEGPVQWSEASRIECGRTVFLMFASEMFQYRLAGAYLDQVTKERQLKLLAEVEEEERIEKIKKQKEMQKAKEKAEMEKKKKQLKKEKAAANNSDKRAALAKKKQLNNNSNSNNSSSNSSSTSKISSKAEIISPTAVEESSDEEEEEEEDSADDEEEFETFVEKPVEIVEPLVLKEIPVVLEKELVIEEVVQVPVPVPTVKPVPEPIFAHIPVKIEQVQVQVPVSVSHIAATPTATPSTSPNYCDDDFDPNQLIEELSKEMNNFELNSLPPGFDTATVQGPPGFSAPKHLDFNDNEFVGGMRSKNNNINISNSDINNNDNINNIVNNNSNYSNPPFSLFNPMDSFYRPHQPLQQQHQIPQQQPMQQHGYSDEYFAQYPQHDNRNMMYPPQFQPPYGQYTPHMQNHQPPHPSQYNYHPQQVPMMNMNNTPAAVHHYQNTNQIPDFSGYQGDFIPPNYQMNYQNLSGVGAGNGGIRNGSVDINSSMNINLNMNSMNTNNLVTSPTNKDTDNDTSSSTTTGTSRFQSFFSNSIFGPSSFFS